MGNSDFLSNPHRYLHAPRTLDEAERGASYANAITSYKNDYSKEWTVLLVTLVNFAIAGGTIWYLMTQMS